MIAAVPTPLPNKPQPSPNPVLHWIGRDLVRAEIEVTPIGSPSPQRSTLTYRAEGVATKDGFASKGPTDAKAFSRLDETSFVDAVEAASRIAATNPIHLEGIVRPDPAETTASRAIGLLQARDGAYYTTAFVSAPHPAALTVDTGRSSFVVHDVEALHPDLKAVVGAHSWVNFTGEDITPALAD